MDSNERLEFLGDAILGAIVCEQLFEQFPNAPEGELTRIKSVVVSRNTCTKLAREKELDQFIFVGKGLAMTESLPESLLAGMFEAIIAGIYLDGGIEPVHLFLDPLIETRKTQRHHALYMDSITKVCYSNTRKKSSHRLPFTNCWMKKAPTIPNFSK